MIAAGNTPSSVVLLAGAAAPIGQAIARAVLQAGGSVAAAVTRPWQVNALRDQLAQAAGADGDHDAAASVADRLLIGVVGARDAEAAAGFVKGSNDALGPITDLVAAARELREPVAGREPAGDLDDLLDINLHSGTTLARAVLPSLRRRGRGSLHLLGVAETHGLSATTRSSLAAARAVFESLADDLADAAGVGVQHYGLPIDEAQAGAEAVRLLVGG